MIEAWRKHYNDVRPHSSLGYLTPAEFAAQRHPAAIRQATGRAAAVCGAYALRPAAQPLAQGHIEAETGVVVSS